MPSEIDHGTSSWGQRIAAIARTIARDDYPPGDLAQLRRLGAYRPDGAAFWRLAAEHAVEAFESGRLARALAITLRGMAIAHANLPGGGRRLGTALAESGVTEQRVLRLLRADTERLDEELRQLARLLVSKGEPGAFDWADAFRLVRSAGRADEEEVRRRIARDYFRRVFEIDRQSQGKAA